MVFTGEATGAPERFRGVCNNRFTVDTLSSYIVSSKTYIRVKLWFNDVTMTDISR